MQKPSIPAGTRDFSPSEMVRRNFIFDTIKTVFKLYGYLPIETPAMENLSTLLGKYGEEGDKLLFKILNSGDFLKDIDQNQLSNSTTNAVALKICEKGLRYDLTVPFARFVVQHQNEISFPFKRYQIQPVWRADKPQKGRYREFYQCDADVVGSNSLLNEAELIQLIDEVFNRLGISITVKLNNRKILAGIAEFIQAPEYLTEITMAIDKIDKMGLEKVNIELAERGLTKDSVEKLQPILQLKGTNEEKLTRLKDLLKKSEIALKGIEEMEEIFRMLALFTLNVGIELDLTLARGLNYYTGIILEVKANNVAIGSICGGGRYDNLTGVFGLEGISGVGISFGADRIYDVMSQLELFPANTNASSKVLLIGFGQKELDYCLLVATQLRKQGISTEIYPENAKIKKQMGYANTKNIPWVILIGENEMNSGKLTLKNMETGNQDQLEINQIISRLTKQSD